MVYCKTYFFVGKYNYGVIYIVLFHLYVYIHEIRTRMTMKVNSKFSDKYKIIYRIN